MKTIRVLGRTWHLLTLEITRERMEDATPSQLARMVRRAELDMKLCRECGYYERAEECASVLAHLKAQQRISANRASLEHGCICG